jgi:hypothetical protein
MNLEDILFSYDPPRLVRVIYAKNMLMTRGRRHFREEVPGAQEPATPTATRESGRDLSWSVSTRRVKKCMRLCPVVCGEHHKGGTGSVLQLVTPRSAPVSSLKGSMACQVCDALPESRTLLSRGHWVQCSV